MRKRIVLIVLALSVGIPAAWYLLSPLFYNVEVNESLPGVEVRPTSTVVNILADPALAGQATQTMEALGLATPKVMEEPMPTQAAASPVILFQGEFYNLAHEGMGTATIYLLPDGTRVLRFENFAVLNGPDLHVYLTVQDPVPDTVGSELEGAFDLGGLKGNIGDQNYDIPADLDLSGYHSVVIWCQPFRVPFNAASLQAP